jgi:hypothetical protein
MSKTARIFRQRWLAVVVLMVGVVTSAFAVPPNQVLKASNLPPLVGQCCFSFNETVAVAEPLKPVPVVVTWSGLTGETFGDHFVGLIVNDGTCQFYGPGSIQEQGSSWNTHLAQWIVFPSDGLKAGLNTFTLCGGGAGLYPDDPFWILDNTLAVRLSN